MKKCKVCGSSFEAYRPLQIVCSVPCSKAWARVKAEKEQKQTIKLLHEKIKSHIEWKREAQTSFNAFIRARDHHLPCISCGNHRQSNHAGHYVSVGASSYLRYNELNVNKQCAACNVGLRGNIINYRKGLIQKIGLSEVDLLENAPRLKKWSIDELKDIKKEYAAKVRQLKIGLE